MKKYIVRKLVIDREKIFVRKVNRQHLGHQLWELEGKIASKTMRKLQEYEAYTKKQYGLAVLDTLFILHWQSKCIVKLAKRVQLSDSTLARIFDLLAIPRLSKAEATRRHNFIFNASLTPEQKNQRNKRLLAYHTSLTQEQKKERQRIMMRHLTHERLSAAGKKGSDIYHASWTPKQREQQRQRARKSILALHASFTPEQRRERATKASHSIPPKQRRENGRKSRLAANMKPNGLEKRLIAILQELGIYSSIALTAPKGHVYYADSLANKRWIRLSDGNKVIPDFKVKGMKKVIEIYGDYWHSKKFCESKGKPAYKWNAQKMIEEYAAVGYEALVIREKDLKNPQQTDAIKKALSYFSIGHIIASYERLR